MKKILMLIALVGILLSSCQKSENKDYDIIVYGGTSAGVIAAYSASLEGRNVLLVEPGNHLGGLSSGGLGQTDIGNKYAVTGLARNFYRRLGDHYGKLEAWKFEPHVAEDVFNQYIKEAGVDVLYDFRLTGVNMKKKRIESVKLEQSSAPSASTNRTITGSYFIDCSYEGDLMAAAGVSYTVGRESNDTYGETYNGVQLREAHQFPDSIDPYIKPGDPSSGLCWGIQAVGVAPRGTGDTLVQAYNYRLCLTQDTSNMVAVTRPVDYDPAKFELLRRVITKREEQGWKQNLGQLYLIISPMPNGKTDINNKGPMSTDGIGMNYAYPEGSYAVRKQIADNVEDYTKELLYFLGHDEALPVSLRDQMLSWGWAADEFTDNGNFPHQMYIREARRMIGGYVMTQHNCLGDSVVNDGIALAAYTMDSHNCQRVVVNGMVKNEGDVQIGGFPPYEISYR
ncbi:MAG TPA: FAD-dependent oxidoreductase, partial [Bacteroidales bacterium]|nr:FAD-dependent oxidoreductase [Bacteroidales bacterium]